MEKKKENGWNQIEWNVQQIAKVNTFETKCRIAELF